ncbi:MAG: bifunctional riboflavin kinase/FAD synthetase [Planctomycetota bacterium]
MKLLRSLASFPAALQGGAVSIGNFDGVHLGHAQIIERLVAQARRCGGPAVVFTFDPHPSRVLRPQQAPTPLSTAEQKAELLTNLGVDAVVAYPTDRALLDLEPEDFFEQIVVEKLGARAMVEGHDFFFGRARRGDSRLLEGLCAAAGITLEVVDALCASEEVVSSSRIRRLISDCRMEEASSLLTRPYRIAGVVERGAGRGRKLGYPTANIGQIATLLPGEGIYAGLAWTDGRAYPAAISLGGNPTFGEGALKVEVFLIGFSGDLYDRRLAVDFLTRLRDIVRFASVDELIAQMQRDVETTRRIALSEISGNVAMEEAG